MREIIATVCCVHSTDVAIILFHLPADNAAPCCNHTIHIPGIDMRVLTPILGCRGGVVLYFPRISALYRSKMMANNHRSNENRMVYEQRERPAARVGPCCARAVRLLALYLGHHFVSRPQSRSGRCWNRHCSSANFPFCSPWKVNAIAAVSSPGR